jgi:hypothetical protein
LSRIPSITTKQKSIANLDNHCLAVIACLVDIGGIVDHHCLELIFCCADIGRFFLLPLFRGDYSLC